MPRDNITLSNFSKLPLFIELIIIVVAFVQF